MSSSSSKPPRPGTFSYKIKWLIVNYAEGSVDNETFKVRLKGILSDFPMSDENASACICKYLRDQEKYGPLSVDDVKHIADLIGEVDPGVGYRLKSWVEEIYK